MSVLELAPHRAAHRSGATPFLGTPQTDRPTDRLVGIDIDAFPSPPVLDLSLSTSRDTCHLPNSCTCQATYERMVLDQLAISLADGRDLQFKNAWSDHVWIGEAEVRRKELCGGKEKGRRE